MWSLQKCKEKTYTVYKQINEASTETVWYNTNNNLTEGKKKHNY